MQTYIKTLPISSVLFQLVLRTKPCLKLFIFTDNNIWLFMFDPGKKKGFKSINCGQNSKNALLISIHFPSFWCFSVYHGLKCYLNFNPILSAVPHSSSSLPVCIIKSSGLGCSTLTVDGCESYKVPTDIWLSLLCCYLCWISITGSWGYLGAYEF